VGHHRLFYGHGWSPRDLLFAQAAYSAVKIFGVGRGGREERTPLLVPRLNKLRDFWNTLFERSGAVPVTISQNLVAD
jgi:hypothetical protein